MSTLAIGEWGTTCERMFNRQYLEHTTQVAATCQDRDLSDDCMVIGTSAIIDTELPISIQFHHTQMDGAHAGRFLANLQKEIDNIKS